MSPPPNPKRVCIVVLGDIGRSPRMQYHAVSLSKNGYNVDIVGYPGSVPNAQLLGCESVSLHYVSEPPNFSSLPNFLRLFLKSLWQAITLFLTLLFFIKKPDSYFVQNPPAVPTLPVVYLVSKILRKKFIIDWHNYGYTMLALQFANKNSFVVRIYRKIELYFGSKADYHFCVTEALQIDLKPISAIVLYDRPAEIFHPISVDQKHALFIKLSEEFPCFKSGTSPNSKSTRTAFTEIKNGKATLRNDRPVLLISSTSWTLDEDFSVLLKALELYDNELPPSDDFSQNSQPRICCVITGKGPLKEHYSKLIKSKHFNYVEFCLPWLKSEDYPPLLASSDLGVSLHNSSSGLDLPMKVVDMFGCGLPVCALSFNCLGELVRNGENGMVFESSLQLAEQLRELLRGFPSDCKKLEQFRKNLEEFQKLKWNESWNEVARPVFQL